MKRLTRKRIRSRHSQLHWLWWGRTKGQGRNERYHAALLRAYDDVRRVMRYEAADGVKR